MSIRIIIGWLFAILAKIEFVNFLVANSRQEGLRETIIYMHNTYRVMKEGYSKGARVDLQIVSVPNHGCEPTSPYCPSAG